MRPRYAINHFSDIVERTTVRVGGATRVERAAGAGSFKLARKLAASPWVLS